MNIELYNQTKDLMKRHQWESVIEVLDDQVLKKNKDWKLYWNAGWSNFKINNLSKAKSLFDSAITVTDSTDDKSICLTFLGLSELEENAYQQASETLEKALQLKDSTLTRQNLALAFMNLNEVEKAEQIHLDGLQLEPGNKERLASYGNFLIDTGRDEEAEVIKSKLKA